MSTAFTSLVAELAAALAAAPALAGGRIGINRLRPIPAGQSTAIVLRLERSNGSEFVLGTLRWNTTILVECYARAVAGSDPAAAVDDLLQSTWQRLAAFRADLLGADVCIDPMIKWDYDDSETPVVCAAIQLTASQSTSTSSLQAQL
ncbi:MAG: hypothetical protein Q7U05_01040 [Polaromonas sp.]|nr:hypothetical protein [Polaromonas sp.]